jgi:hypothetical protein
LGNKYFIIPLETFKCGQHGDNYVFDIDKATFEQEEGFDRNEYLTQTKLFKAYMHYKLKPYLNNKGLSYIYYG